MTNCFFDTANEIEQNYKYLIKLYDSSYNFKLRVDNMCSILEKIQIEEMKKIIPNNCPFCESSNVKVRMNDGNHYAVTCGDCSAVGPEVGYGGGSEEDIRKILAIERWNARSKIGQLSLDAQFVSEIKRRRDEHICCYCDACMRIKHEIFMNRINDRLLNAIEINEKNKTT